MIKKNFNLENIITLSETLSGNIKYRNNYLDSMIKIDDYDLSQIKETLEKLIINKEKIHPIILDHYSQKIKKQISKLSKQKLQTMIILKHIEKLTQNKALIV